MLFYIIQFVELDSSGGSVILFPTCVIQTFSITREPCKVQKFQIISKIHNVLTLQILIEAEYLTKVKNKHSCIKGAIQQECKSTMNSIYRFVSCSNTIVVSYLDQKHTSYIQLNVFKKVDLQK